MKLAGKRVGVVGLGESGYWASLFLKDKGAEVWVTDKDDNPKLREKLAQLEREGIKGELGRHSLEELRKCEVVVLSPGINPSENWIRLLEESGVKIIGELELGLKFVHVPYIMVTGTNGKTTTAQLLKILCGEGVECCGNIGIPITRLLLEGKNFSGLVIEASSFQLKYMKDFSPTISIILNIDEDHLDWHPSREDYISSKMKIFAFQKRDDFTLWNADEDWWKGITPSPQVYFFSPQPHDLKGCFIRQEWVIWREEKEIGVFPLKEWKLPGLHNLYNLTAAVGGAMLWGVKGEEIRKRIKKFRPLPHRLEFAGEWKGVKFINDSKATNVHATYFALLSLPPGIILILGGRDKGNVYTPLFPLVKSKVRYIVATGESRNKIEEVFKRFVPVIKRERFEEAFKEAVAKALPGDTVLLSPACSSFDQFTNYKERGEFFKKLVKSLIK